MNPTPAAAIRPTIWNRNFICVFTANAMLSLAHSSINTLVSVYAKHLGAGAVLMGLLTGLFFGVSLAMRPATGPMSTKLNKRTLMIFVFALGALVNLGYALFPHIGMFVLFRFFHGMQYSLVGSLIMTIAGDSLPKEKLASGMGVYSVGGAVMFAVAPSIGVFLLDLGTQLRDKALGFELVFLFGAVASLLAVIPSLLLLPDGKTKEERASTGAWYKNIITVHAVPIAAMMALLCMSQALFSSYIILFAAEQGIAGVSAFFTVSALVITAARPLSGRLTDIFGVRKIMIPALVIFASSFVVVGLSRSLLPILAGAVLAALGYGAAQPTLQAMAIQTETPLKRGVASNTLYAGIDLGFFAGPFLGSVVYKFSGFSAMYLAGAVPILLAILCFVVLCPGYARRLKALEAADAA